MPKSPWKLVISVAPKNDSQETRAPKKQARTRRKECEPVHKFRGFWRTAVVAAASRIRRAAAPHRCACRLAGAWLNNRHTSLRRMPDMARPTGCRWRPAVRVSLRERRRACPPRLALQAGRTFVRGRTGHGHALAPIRRCHRSTWFASRLRRIKKTVVTENNTRIITCREVAPNRRCEIRQCAATERCRTSRESSCHGPASEIRVGAAAISRKIRRLRDVQNPGPLFEVLIAAVLQFQTGGLVLWFVRSLRELARTLKSTCERRC